MRAKPVDRAAGRRVLALTDHPSALAITVVALPVLAYVGQPVIALIVGACLGLALDDAPLRHASKTGARLLQTAIVLIGVGMNLDVLIELSASTAGWVALFVLCTLTGGVLIGRALGIETPLSRLIAAGTAICGATAIATLAPLLRARAEHVALALTIVFTLNAIAMLSFPMIGTYLGMTQYEFGLWSAVAIHDTSSVVGTAAAYGEEAAVVAATVKLGRTLWLIPLALAFSLIGNAADAKVRVPVFVLLFIGAAASNAVVDLPAMVFDISKTASKVAIICALFFVGTEFRRRTFKQLQGRVIWQALGLWTLVVAATLAAIVAVR